MPAVPAQASPSTGGLTHGDTIFIDQDGNMQHSVK
jgi:hypothetical protein